MYKYKDSQRFKILEFLDRLGVLPDLFRRTNFTAIGLTGHVSDLDRDVARAQRLAPLNEFENWLLGPFIEEEKRRRKEGFRLACIETLGEDPNDWR